MPEASRGGICSVRNLPGRHIREGNREAINMGNKILEDMNEAVHDSERRTGVTAGASARQIVVAMNQTSHTAANPRKRKKPCFTLKMEYLIKNSINGLRPCRIKAQYRGARRQP